MHEFDPEVAGAPSAVREGSCSGALVMGQLVQMGFQTAGLTRACDGMEEVLAAIEAIGAARNDLPYDGAVVNTAHCKSGWAL